MTKLILTAATLALLAAGPAPARRHWGDDRGPDQRPPAAVLYSKPGFQGHSFYADHEVRKLSTKDMDDKISSIHIISGVWQVCVDDKFEGRCEIVDHSMPDTRVINMDDKISSVRPVPPGGPGWQR
ncbi:beta/gamma crystallin family protein [Sphingomonas sp. CGMCC 1.13654]|uniref:Beta/gamma crystallin family protein n=1 Tax=Sphingomonas chungangi TaxID=2683589 RepID=A0A838L2I4_9SPHN|nr:beta/gamma crystallin-related protein [Sphingomonas chungangi]MBA2932732.1 beta/gamma crystallin family protein [Sphingomonas chungangi]MVW56354.1 hypothetical protein [Sphingomonas chungangi]